MGLSASKSFGNFPVECFDDIFRHLDDEEDLLECTLVCPSWNEYIGSSRWCMENISLVCPEEVLVEDLKNALLNSKRKYMCIYVHGVYSNEMRDFLSLNRTWTSVVSDMCFETFADFLDFLRVIQTSIHDLGLYGEIVKTDVELGSEVLDFLFPHLKILRVGPSFSLCYHKTFINCKNLEELEIIACDRISHSAKNAIKTSLKSNNRLKKLEFCNDLVIDIDFLTEVSFRLSELNASELRFDGYSIQDFAKFLMKQSDTLEVLKIDGWKTITKVFKIISSMFRLRKLYLTGDEDVSQPLEVKSNGGSSFKNFSLTALGLIGLNISNKSLKVLLNVFSSVQILDIDRTDDENIDDIAKAYKIFLYKP